MSFLRPRKGTPAPDGTMSLMQHLYELRRRLFYATLAILVGTVIGFIWYTLGIPSIGLPSLGDILIRPYCAVPPSHRLIINGDPHSCAFLATTAFSQITVRMQAGLLAGLALSSPFWLHQLWAFVTPALYSKEKRFARIFVSTAAVLFIAGAVIAYFVIGKALEVLLGFGGDTAVAALSPDAYFTFLLGVLLIFGLSMELPLLLVMLNFAGVLQGAKLAKIRRYAWFGLVVFTAFVVPGNDPISMGVLALVLIVLYEVAVVVSKSHDKRKAIAASASGFEGLSDDEASPMPELIGAGRVRPVEVAEAIAAPTAVMTAAVTAPQASAAPIADPAPVAEPAPTAEPVLGAEPAPTPEPAPRPSPLNFDDVT